jgi:hypothetical protein
MTALDLAGKLTVKQEQDLQNFTISMYFGWMAYTLIDDFIDQQASIQFAPLTSSLKNLCFKYALAVGPEFMTLVLDSFNKTDAYYIWEIENARVKNKSFSELIRSNWNYEYITRRMSSYLSAIYWLPNLIGINDAKVSRRLYQFYNNLVIIHQLNDDAKDWKQDMEMGVMTFVLWHMLINRADEQELEQVLWSKTIPKIATDCEKMHVECVGILNTLNLNHDLLKQVEQKNYASISKLVKGLKTYNQAKQLIGIED